MKLNPTKMRGLLYGATSGVCIAFFLSVARCNAQGYVLDSYGQGGQDAGVDVIYPGYPVTLEWSQSNSFTNVSISAGLASFNSSGTGWAMLSEGNTLIASTEFDYPINYGRVELFDGLSLPSGTYYLNIGAFTGADDGWGVPVADTLYTADGVAYIGTFTHWGESLPIDVSIFSVPEPSVIAMIELGLFAIARRSLWSRSFDSMA